MAKEAGAIVENAGRRLPQRRRGRRKLVLPLAAVTAGVSILAYRLGPWYPLPGFPGLCTVSLGHPHWPAGDSWGGAMDAQMSPC